MKKKYIGTVFSLFFYCYFFRFFFYVIYYGNNVDYNAMHKIVTVEGNRVLFLCAIVGDRGTRCYYFLRKLPTTPRTITVFAAVTVAVCVLLYDPDVNISKCIAFYAAGTAEWWPIRHAGSSRRRTGYDDYCADLQQQYSHYMAFV